MATGSLPQVGTRVQVKGPFGTFSCRVTESPIPEDPTHCRIAAKSLDGTRDFHWITRPHEAGYLAVHTYEVEP
jgi:hypothetical protein